MAKLVLKRDVFTESFTLGRLSIDGSFFCYTVEDKVRNHKIAGITAIPAGVYKVILNMSNRFKKILPLLIDVPNFAGVRIHAGNAAADTEGCLIVGKERTAVGVARSRDAMAELMEILAKSKESEIEIA